MMRQRDNAVEDLEVSQFGVVQRRARQWLETRAFSGYRKFVQVRCSQLIALRRRVNFGTY
jgi:hypothetical protein